MIIAYGPTEYFHINRWDSFHFDLKTLKALPSQFIILMHISSSVVRTTRVYFYQGWGEKKEKTSQSEDRRHFE